MFRLTWCIETWLGYGGRSKFLARKFWEVKNPIKEDRATDWCLFERGSIKNSIDYFVQAIIAWEKLLRLLIE